MRVMIFDVKTNADLLFEKPSDDPRQPHIVHYAAVLIDSETGEIIDREHAYVLPDGWSVADNVLARHGVTTEYAETHGVSERMAVTAYDMMVSKADRVAAHFVDFHLRAMRTAMLRSGMPRAEVDARAKTVNKYDIMRMATPLCKLPPTEKQMARGVEAFKQPTMQEVAYILLGEEFPDVADANVSVNTAMKLYLALNPIVQSAA